ncbi:MAG: Gfo/Idh/MocA family oxidoreductase [Opitutaceae bacterium]|jgi:predicted dehydrogenase|nr:Gfo/Idh/MocA family oxidoreductase [Opitutaceae bacterium]
MPASRKISVAIAGCNIGAQQAAAFAKLGGFRLAALCDTDRARAEALAGQSGAPGVTTDLGALCARDDIDIISLCTPPVLHHAQIKQALAAGKNVICEKPLTGSPAAVDDIIATAEKSGRWVMPIFQLRFGAAVQKLRRLVADGVTGPLDFASAETAWRRGDAYYGTPWRRTWRGSLGGALFGQAIHAHDLLTCIGGRATAAFAIAATRVNQVETEDCAAGTLRLAGGAVASIGVTLGSMREITRLRFCFRHLTAESNTGPYDEVSREPWTFSSDGPATEAAMRDALAGFAPGPGGYEGQFGALLRALREDRPPPVTLADARESIELAATLYHSIATGRLETLPLAAAHPFYCGWQEVMGKSLSARGCNCES